MDPHVDEESIQDKALHRTCLLALDEVEWALFESKGELIIQVRVPHFSCKRRKL